MLPLLTKLHSESNRFLHSLSISHLIACNISFGIELNWLGGFLSQICMTYNCFMTMNNLDFCRYCFFLFGFPFHDYIKMLQLPRIIVKTDGY